MESKSLVEIITEEDFSPLVKEPVRNFFKIYSPFVSCLEKTKDISRKFYSNIVQEAEFLESFLDEYGARENKKWSAFTEYVASIRNLGIAGFFLRHLLDRYPNYRLSDPEETDREFHEGAKDALKFLNQSILNLFNEMIQSGKSNGLLLELESVISHEFTDREITKRLPKTISEDEVNDEEERIVDICEKIQNVARMMEETAIKETRDLEALKRIVPEKIDEKKARHFKNMVHSVQSDFDTYVKNTRLEKDNPLLKNLRGYISMPLHLLEMVLWLCHFYERHEDEIRHDECKRQIAGMVDKNHLLKIIVNFAFRFSLHYIREGEKFAGELLRTFLRVSQIEVAIPTPLGFHARPSTYVSLIAREHGGDLFLIVDGEKYNAKSVMSLLQAGGAIADKGYQTVVFEGERKALDDIKILAGQNYCEEKEIPRKLNYLRVARSAS